MNLIKDFFKSRKEKKIASEIVNQCYAEVAKELGITKYKPPKIRLGDLDEDTGGEYHRSVREITLRKDQIELYIKCLDNEEYFKKLPENMRAPEKYDEVVKLINSTLEKTYKSLKGIAVHEITHDLDKVDAFKESVLRRGQEGIADFAKSLLTNETKEELVYLIHKYRDAGPPKSQNHIKNTGVYAYLDELEKRKTGESGLLGKIENILTVLIPNHEKEIAKLKNDVKLAEEGSVDALFGYRLGALAALGVYDLSKKERISKINELLNDPDLHNRLSELETLAEKGIEVYMNEMRKNKPDTSVKVQEKIGNPEDDVEAKVRAIYEPVKKRKNNNVPIAAVSVMLLIAFLLFETKKETTSASVGLVTQTMIIHQYTIFSIIFLSVFFLYLRKNKLN